MADTPDAPATDPWSMTPNEVAAKLAAMDAAIHPPPPLIPQDAQDARAQLDLLSRNASWAESLFKGNVETRKQFDELVAKAAGGDNVGDAVAGIVELTPPLFETTANGELPRRHVEGTIAGLRDAGLNDAAIEQAVNLPPISRAEFMAAQAFKARCHGSAEVPVIVARYKANERATRAYGADATGEGAVFEIPEDAIKHSRDPATFPWYWPWLWAVDFSHGGMSAQAHPFAAVLGCWDRDADCIYIVHAIRMRQALPVSHVAAIKSHPCWDAPVAWPHDGGHTGFESTETFAATYKRLGLNMRPTHAVFPRGGFNFESGITEIEQRLATGRLKIASHLAEIFDEYRGYHRVAGLVHKVDDDLLSAIRVLCMDIRYAKALAPDRPGQAGFMRQERSMGIAKGTDFDLFNTSVDF
jgi:hypothetical protein